MALVDRLLDAFSDVGVRIRAMLPRLLPAGGAVGQTLRKSGAGDYATEWSNPGYPLTIGRTTSNQQAASTSLTTISGLTAPLAAGGVYRLTGRVVFQTSGLAVGATIGFNGPAGSVAQMVLAVPTTALVSTNTATVRSNGSSGSASTTSVAATGMAIVATVDGILTVGSTPGTFALQVASSSVLGSVTVLAGSTLVAERLS